MSRHGSRPVAWEGTTDASADITTMGFERPIVTSTVFENYTKPTVVRLQGCLQFRVGRTSGQTDVAVDQLVDYFAGIMVVHEDIGVADITTTDMQANWMWTCLGTLWAPFEEYPTADSGVVFHGVLLTGFRTIRHELDTRVMRKVPRNHKLSLFGTTPTATGSLAGPFLTSNIRVLVKD